MEYRSRFADAQIDALFEAILRLRSVEDCYRFFEDLCTLREIRSMALRFYAARLLHEGATYGEVHERTGLSSATITRIRRFLLDGADGYKLVLQRLGTQRAAARPLSPVTDVPAAAGRVPACPKSAPSAEA